MATSRKRQWVLVSDTDMPPERNISAIFEFKITLRDVKPMIWRRVQVPKEFNFEELHFSIQAVMGWGCSHAYTFHVPDPDNKEKTVDITHPLSYDLLKETMECFPANNKNIADYFKEKGDGAVYEYDHGDSWEHEVVLFKILPVGPRSEYPKAIAGKRACPPENSGGSERYEDMLKVIKDPNDEEYAEYKEWLDELYNGQFDPEKFDPNEVNFDRFKVTCVPKKVKKTKK